MTPTTEPYTELRGPFTDEVLEALKERNEQRLKEAIQQLGEKWLLWEPLQGKKQ